MKRQEPKRARSASATLLRKAVVAAGLAIPTISLIPLGSIWLWQRGYLLYWAVAVLLATIAAWVIQHRLLPDVAEAEPRPVDASADGGPAATPLEAEAWRNVREIAETADMSWLADRDRALALAIEVVGRVAHVMRPGAKDPVWHFTAPEVLALVEQVSRRLRIFVDESVPLGDRLTIAQVMQLYRWRGVVDAAHSAYDVWRVIRLLNPITAATNELRERFSGQLFRWGKAHIARRLTEVFVEEVGRAAIDLYSGRLRVLTESDIRASAPIAGEREESAPLRIFVGGQLNSGKSSLVNGLGSEAGAAVDVVPTTAAFTAHALSRDELPGAVIVDSPGLGGSSEQRRDTVDAAAGSDLVIWVVVAHRADREIDRAALAELRHHFSERPDRKPPPLMLVLTCIDQLRPWHEWLPPYDLEDASRAKAVSIRDAILAAAEDLSFDPADVVPVCVDPAVGLYNVDTVWGRIVDLVPEARQTQLVRILRTSSDRRSWARTWSQAVKAGRVIAGNIVRPGQQA